MSFRTSLLRLLGFSVGAPARPAAVPGAAPADPADEADADMQRALGLPDDPIGTLARTLWGEARGDGEDGMHAVANVVMNRVNHPSWWGRSTVSVCLEPFQFSCWNQDSPERGAMLRVTDADPSFRAAEQIATLAVMGKLPDITAGSDSYFAQDIPTPRWALPIEFRVQVGHQKFYRTETAPLKNAREA